MSLEKLIGRQTQAQREEHWIPLSDLMTGLMLMFMLIAIVFMIKVEAEAQKVKNIAVLYDKMREQLYVDLENEFRDDLPRWGATLDRDLAIRFEEPKVLFDTGEADLKPEFQIILHEFFPRYAKILASEKYKDSIEEIRIEGHTSSGWSLSAQTPPDVAYFKNMELSQGRTRTTLQYVLSFPQVAELKSWLTSRLTANGLSSSRLRMNPNGTENREASQRVEFRVRTNAEERIGEMLQAAPQ